MRDLAQLDALCDATAERFGGIDIVVANAGVGAYGPFLDLSQEHLDEMIDVNLKGTLYAVRAALPHMLGREGDVITLASEAGRRGLPLRGRLLRVEVRPGRLHARARPRAARARASAARTSAPAASPPTSRSTTAAAGRPTCCPG